MDLRSFSALTQSDLKLWSVADFGSELQRCTTAIANCTKSSFRGAFTPLSPKFPKGPEIGRRAFCVSNGVVLRGMKRGRCDLRPKLDARNPKPLYRVQEFKGFRGFGLRDWTLKPCEGAGAGL